MTEPTKHDPETTAVDPRAVDPRAVALGLLRQVLGERRSLDTVLERDPGIEQLADRDRAFARRLVTTVLRRLGQLDDLIDRFLSRPLPSNAAPVHDVLRLGVCQILFSEVPDHAAVDSSVRLAEATGHPKLKNLVNAVLRRLTRERAALEPEPSAAQGAGRLNTPDWLWHSWCAAYGESVAHAIAEAHLHEPPLDLTAKTDPAGWAKTLEATVLPTGSLRRERAGAVSALPGYDEGAWWVQDAAASLPARLLGDLHGRRVIDLCAAPGGKTAQIAAAGGKVIAIDRSAVRLRRLDANLSRLGLNAETVAADAVLWRPDTLADAVLLDAPCSATGTIRRHPDVQWLKRPEDVRKLTVVQDRLLAAAVEMLRPGATLVYCTCSLQPEEGPLRITKLLAGGAALERVPVQAKEIGKLDVLIDRDGDLRTLPCHLNDAGGMDGFYAARLRKI